MLPDAATDRLKATLFPEAGVTDEGPAQTAYRLPALHNFLDPDASGSRSETIQAFNGRVADLAAQQVFMALEHFFARVPGATVELGVTFGLAPNGDYAGLWTVRVNGAMVRDPDSYPLGSSQDREPNTQLWFDLRQAVVDAASPAVIARLANRVAWCTWTQDDVEVGYEGVVGQDRAAWVECLTASPPKPRFRP